MKLLLVDDDQTILDLVGQFLCLTDTCEVQPAISAEAALKEIDKAEEPFDCLLVDIQMPDIDGIALVETVRDLPGYRDTPKIMLTAMRDADYVERAFSAGATDYVTKPIDFEELQRRIRDAVQLSQRKSEVGIERGTEETGDGTSDQGAPKPPVEEPVSLTEVKSFVDSGEFANYLRQTQRLRLFRTPTISVRIASVDKVHAELPAEAFRTLLHDVAVSLEKRMLDEGGVLTYRGDGVFVCAPRTRPQGSRADLEKRLNRHYHSHYPPNGRIGIWLRVEEPKLVSRRSEGEDVAQVGDGTLQNEPRENVSKSSRLSALRQRRRND